MSQIVKRFAVSYLRFSSKRQAKGSTTERQGQLLTGYLARNPDVELLEHFEDKGVSGFRGKHATEGALSRFLNLLKAGKLPTPLILLVESIDRLSREAVMDAFDRFSEITRYGVRIVFLDMPYPIEIDRDLMNRDQSKVYEVIGAIQRAHGESLRKSDLVRAAWAISIRNAKEHGFAIKGYIGPPWTVIDKSTNRYVIGCPQTVETVKMIYDWRIDGMADHSIAKRLNERGVPVFRASVTKGTVRQGWYQSYVSALLENRQVLGEHQFKNDEEVIVGYFPEIISPQTFHRAQQARKVRARKIGKTGPTVSNLFTQVAKCAHCGGNMEMTRNRSGSADGPDPIKYLMCSSRKRRFQCEGRGMINYPKLEETVLDFLREIPWSDIVRMENPDNPLPALDDEIAKVEIEIERLTKQRKRAAELMMKGPEFEEEFGPVLQAVLPKVKDANVRHSALVTERTRLAQVWSSRPALVNNAMEFSAQMNNISVAERFNIRTRLSDTLGEMITRMECDAPGKVVHIKVSDSYSFRIEMPIRRSPTTRGGFGHSASIYSARRHSVNH